MVDIVLTGFEPFDGAPSNASGEAIIEVGRTWRGPGRLITAILPVEFGAAAATLDRLITWHNPRVVIATGVAQGRSDVTPEALAVNIRDARIADNAGQLPLAQTIDGLAPTVHWSTLPNEQIIAALNAEGIPASESLTAGTFVCNEVFFSLARWETSCPRTGFIHVPASPSMGTHGPIMRTEVVARALTVAIATTLDGLVNREASG